MSDAGPGRLIPQVPVAARRSGPSRKRRARRRDSSAEGASNLESGGVGALSVEKVLGAVRHRRREAGGYGRCDRKRQWPGLAARVVSIKHGVGYRVPSKRGRAPWGERVMMVTAGERGSNCVTTQVWKCLRAIQCPPWRVRSQACTSVYVGRSGVRSGRLAGPQAPPLES